MSNNSFSMPENGGATVPDESFCAALASVPGLDCALGLRHLRGRSDSYVRLLRKFAETRATDIEAMHRNISARDHDELARLAHNIKGVSGFLGAVGVEALASELHAALRAGCNEAEIDRLALALADEQSGLAAGVLALPFAKSDD